MKYSDMHMHGYYSDGKGKPVEFAVKAKETGIETLGFSDHSPVPFENSWSMKLASLEKYINEIIELKNEFSENPDIYLGIELDYIRDIDVKDYMGFENLPFDYFLGSVHYVYSGKLDRQMEVDGNAGEFKYLVEEGFNSDPVKAYKTYYNNVREMIKEYKPAVAAHLDLIVKNNGKGKYFNESDREYILEVEKTLDVVKKYGTVVEVNAGGMSRGYMERPYPSEYILKRCLELGIGITLNSDAHKPGDIAYKFEEIIKMIKHIGYVEAVFFKKGEWTTVLL